VVVCTEVAAFEDVDAEAIETGSVMEVEIELAIAVCVVIVELEENPEVELARELDRELAEKELDEGTS